MQINRLYLICATRNVHREWKIQNTNFSWVQAVWHNSAPFGMDTVVAVHGNRSVVHNMAEIITCTLDNSARATVTRVRLGKAIQVLCSKWRQSTWLFSFPPSNIEHIGWSRNGGSLAIWTIFIISFISAIVRYYQRAILGKCYFKNTYLSHIIWVCTVPLNADINVSVIFKCVCVCARAPVCVCVSLFVCVLATTVNMTLFGSMTGTMTFSH